MFFKGATLQSHKVKFDDTEESHAKLKVPLKNSQMSLPGLLSDSVADP